MRVCSSPACSATLGWKNTSGLCSRCYQREYKRKERAIRVDELRAYNQAYKLKREAEQPGYYAAKQREWRERNHEVAIARAFVSKQKRRSRLANVEHTLTNQEWLEILAAFDNRCAYCGCSEKMTQDHVIPISKDGGHTKENVVPACRPCNSRKRDKIITNNTPQA